MREHLLVFLLVILSLVPAFAQQPPCGFFDLYQKVKGDPTFQQKQAELDRFTKQFTDQYFKKLSEKKTMADTPLYVIPVVFHVFWDCGEENISKEQMEDAIRILNLDFRAKHPDTSAVIPYFKPRVGNCRVEFRLARKDPQGNCTEGITRHQSPLTHGGDETLKAWIQWPPDQYLNIWVEEYVTYANAAAYATLPGYPPAQDGIVIAHNYVGSIGTGTTSNSHILSHEAGHFFNLEHIWGLSSTPGLSQNCTLDDGVADTPKTIGSVFGCNVAQSTCNDGLDNVQNIMDYSSCGIMFTQGQVARMQAALNSSVGNRNSLWTPMNLQATGTANGYISPRCKPLADMCRKKISLCVGQFYQFKNETYGSDSVGYNWTLPGSVQGISSNKNPLVQYLNPGLNTVQFEAFNSAGSTTFLIEDMIDVVPSEGALLPVNQSFETQNFPYPYWKIESETGNYWEQTVDAAISGATSLRHWAGGATLGKTAIFYTEPYDFTNNPDPFFNFKLAFARKNESIDALRIYISTDCGITWLNRYTKAGSSLATTTDTTSSFVPTASQWREESFSITPAAGKPNVRFRFEFTYRGGQNMYIDDLTIGSITETKPELVGRFSTRIFPNPSQKDAVMQLHLPIASPVSVSLIGLDGHVLHTENRSLLWQGTHSISINRPETPGFYFLKTIAGKHIEIRKICFE